MAFTNEREKKGRLSYAYLAEDATDINREIVEECQKRVIGAQRYVSCGACARIPSFPPESLLCSFS